MFDFEFIENNPNIPTFYTALITIIFSFFLSALIAITYEFTSQDIQRKSNFLQSLALISIVAATIMLAVGDSLAVGLGMLGALSIIRFRTAMSDPRNITFIFAALAAGIASGVLGFSIALTGTLVFCLASILLHFSPWGKEVDLTGIIRIQYAPLDYDQSLTEKTLKNYVAKYELQQIRIARQQGNKKKKNKNPLEEVFYAIRVKKNRDMENFIQSIHENQNAVVGVRFFMKSFDARL